jgi:TDG/mug DNA glycosylase family protein
VIAVRVPDILGPQLRVLFCGINPSLHSAATGHHYARPGNRFWTTLHGAGFTPWLFRPADQRELIGLGYGLTMYVQRATRTAAELTDDEYVAGGRRVVRLVRRHRPRVFASVGIEAYRKAFGRPKATVGLQAETIGESLIWVLPNPSGLNAHYKPADFVRVFAELKAFVRDHT